MDKKRAAALGFIGGAITGLALGVLFAPASGEKTRKDIMKKSKKVVKKVKKIDLDDVREFVVEKTSEIETNLKKYMKDKDLKNAKKKINELKKEVDHLIDYTKDINEDVLQNTIYELKDKVRKSYEKIKEKIDNE